jgi:hypothetical protein
MDKRGRKPGRIAAQNLILLSCSSHSIIFIALRNRPEHYTLPHLNVTCQKQMISTGWKIITYTHESSTSAHVSAIDSIRSGFFVQNMVRYIYNTPCMGIVLDSSKSGPQVVSEF